MQLSCYFTDTAKLSSHQASTPNQPTGPGFEPKPPGKRQLNRKRKFIARVFWSKVFVSCQNEGQIGREKFGCQIQRDQIGQF